jgi:hypothetical protein
VATACIPSSVTEQLPMRWSSVSAVRPATAQTFRALTMACSAALVGKAVHQHICEQRRYTVAVVGGAAPPTPSPNTRAQRRQHDERDDGEG